jgi:hypothetical protein
MLQLLLQLALLLLGLNLDSIPALPPALRPKLFCVNMQTQLPPPKQWMTNTALAPSHKSPECVLVINAPSPASLKLFLISMMSFALVLSTPPVSK